MIIILQLDLRDLHTLYRALRAASRQAQDEAQAHPEHLACYYADATNYSMLHDEIEEQSGRPDMDGNIRLTMSRGG